MKNLSQNIKCPHCGEKIDTNDILEHQLQDQFDARLKDQLKESEADIAKKIQKEKSSHQATIHHLTF